MNTISNVPSLTLCGFMACGKTTLGRTIKKLFGYYPVPAPLTVACILFSSIVTSVPSIFLQNVLAIVEK